MDFVIRKKPLGYAGLVRVVHALALVEGADCGHLILGQQEIEDFEIALDALWVCGFREHNRVFLDFETQNYLPCDYGDPIVSEYHGSAFVVTILKDAWTRTALESLDLNPDQIKAVSYVKVNGWISSSRYAELYKVPMRTSSRELGELARKGVLVLVGKGRQSRYELKSNRARIAPIAPNAEQHTKPQESKGNQPPKRKVSPQTTLQTTLQTTPQTIMGDSPGDLSKMESEIVLAIRSNPEITRTAIASNLGITLDGVKYHLKALRIKLGLRHEGPTKKGRWVFDPRP